MKIASISPQAAQVLGLGKILLIMFVLGSLNPFQFLGQPTPGECSNEIDMFLKFSVNYVISYHNCRLVLVADREQDVRVPHDLLPRQRRRDAAHIDGRIRGQLLQRNLGLKCSIDFVDGCLKYHRFRSSRATESDEEHQLCISLLDILIRLIQAVILGVIETLNIE